MGVPLAMEAEVKSRLTEEMLRILEAFDLGVRSGMESDEE
jgi:hypothetical protein